MGLFAIIKRHKEEELRKKDEQEKAAALAYQQRQREEEAKKERIANCPFMKALISAIQKEPWILHRQNSNDDGVRLVRVTSDLVEFKWATTKGVSRVVGQDRWGIDKYEMQYVEEVCGQAIYNFVQNGYASLELTDQMPFAEVITDKIAELVPGSCFEYYYAYDGDIYSSRRKYTLPYSSHKMF